MSAPRRPGPLAKRRSIDAARAYVADGVIRKRVGGTLVVQLVSTAFRTVKNDLTMLCAHLLAAGEGLAKATCATLGIVTTVELGSVRAT